MTSPTPTLTACPFCGGEPEIINRSVHCNSAACDAQPYTAGRTVEDAIAAWNRRSLAAPPDTLKQAPEALTDERILHLWDTHVGYETGYKGAHLSNKDKLAFARAAIASLQASLAAPPDTTGRDAGAPEGWRPVPLEPTETMVDAACDDVGLCAEDRAADDVRQEYRVAWRAMVAAAPASPAPAHSKSEYKRRVTLGDPSVLPPAVVQGEVPTTPTAREYLEQQFPPGVATRDWVDGWDSCRQFTLGVPATDGSQRDA